jgi:hypothetical protein
MAFEFTMIDRASVVIIECEISSAAMDQLAGTKGTMPDEREAQFLHLRDTIERIASDLFEEGISSPGGTIRIFYHHVRWREVERDVRGPTPPSAKLRHSNGMTSCALASSFCFGPDA